MAQSVKHVPLAQVMIPGSWDGALHWAFCSAGVRFSLSLSLPILSPSLLLTLLNRYIKSLKKEIDYKKIFKKEIKKKNKTAVLRDFAV